MTHEEMEQTLGRLAELQLANQQSLDEILGAINKLERRIKAFIRGSRNGGKQEP